MDVRFCLMALCACLLAGCAPGSAIPDGAVTLDERITLTRYAQFDSAQREFEIDADSVIVAFVDEQTTDVTLKLAIAGDTANEVENNLAGAGVEIATLRAPRGSRVTVMLTGAQNSKTPGHVQLRVRRFDVEPDDPTLAAQLDAFNAWSSATNAGHRVDAIRKSGLADIDRAIARLETAAEDPALAAQARLVRANMFYFFRIDEREARAGAQRAAAAFRVLPVPDALNESRAKYVEALALNEISGDASVNPTSEEATQLARAILTDLGAATSVFGPVERARAIAALGHIDVEAGLTDDGRNRYEEAQGIYQLAGFDAGVRDMKFSLAGVLLSLGRFRDSAIAFDALLPELGKITNPDRRAAMFIHAARAHVFSGRSDDAQELLHDALALAREYNLRSQESAALQGLGNFYLHRGDTLSAGKLYDEVLKITRAQGDTVGINAGLQSAGYVARIEGDYARAIDMHKEGVRIATTPVARMRTMRELGMDYLYAGDYPAAIAQFRGGLAVKLQDPRHHAYSDLKRNLVEALIANGDVTRANRREADRLLAESTESSIRVGDTLSEIGGHRVNGQLLAALGYPADARAEYERALALAHEYREKSASMEARKGMLLHEQQAFRGYLDLELKEVAARGAGNPRPASKREERMLRMVEFARDANYRMSRTGELDTGTAARVEALFGQMGSLSLTIAKMAGRALDVGERAELERLQLEMMNLYAELDRIRTAASTRRAAAENFRADAAREWRAMGPGVVQVSYALGDEHVYVWTRSAAGIRVGVLGKSPKALEQELIELGALDRNSAPVKVEQALERVSAVLLPENLLPENTSAIEIVAEGRIAGVPFAGLASPGNRAQRLAETHAITMITSLFAAEESARPKLARPFRLVALASGWGTMRSAAIADPAPKLQAATSEIQQIASLFEARDPTAKIQLLTGREGNASALRGIWGSGADVVHFATHALADLRQPLASLLVLPAEDAGGRPTYLTAGQVQGWRGDADLVFLSACESAIGPPRFAGGMPGLQSAFLRAGARGVIATLWPIEDVLAREFTADFYRRYTNGQSAAQALSETQRVWLAPKAGASDAEHARRRINALAHGFYTH
jgi:tetratricopeptide (TPR) repeat protein